VNETEAETVLADELGSAEATPVLSDADELKQALEGMGRRPLVMPIIVAVNVAIFVLMAASGVSIITPETMDIIKWGGNLDGLTLTGDWWRLGSSMFIHIGFIHIAMNMAVLWDAGRVVERLLGRLGFFSMYIVSGLLGSVASLVWNSGITSAGASGAVFGVFGCMFALLLRNHGLLPAAARSRLTKSAGLFIAYNVVFGASVDGIDMAAHAGGLAAGFLCGLLLSLPLGDKGEQGQRLRAGLVAGAGAGAVVLALALLPTPDSRPVLIDPGAVVKFDKNAIFYTDGATRGDALSIKRVLTASGYFAKGREVAVRISKEDDTYVVGLVVQTHAANNPEYEDGFRSIGVMLSVQAFDGSTVVIELLDGHLAQLQRLEPVDVDTLSEQGNQPTFLAGLNSKFRSILVRHYPDATNGYLIIVRGLDRDALGVCLNDIDSTGEQFALSGSGDDGSLLLGGVTIGLRWLDADSVIMELRNTPMGPLPVTDPADLASRLSERVGYDGSAQLLQAVGKVDEAASLWIAFADPLGYVEIVTGEDVSISGKAALESEGASEFILESYKLVAGDAINIPSVQSFLAAFSFENKDGNIAFDATFSEAELLAQLEAFMADDVLELLSD
tara:strand:- start:13676 stop:15523 length:1848 start_codon:yes stop_codon:yes gene_type:complete